MQLSDNSFQLFRYSVRAPLLVLPVSIHLIYLLINSKRFLSSSGVSITLRAKSNNNILKTTLTKNDGFYEFKEVLPGDYIIEATHHSWKFKKSEIQMTVSDDNIDITKDSENNLSIFGYEVIGNVMSEGEPIHSVLFALFSRTRRTLLGYDSKQIPIKNMANDLIYLCHVSSDKNGLFRFPTVPVGSYVLVPFYGSNNIKFDVNPKEMSFEVFNENIRIDTVFQIEGFSVSGRVLVDQKGVPNAEVNFRDQTTGRQLTVTTQTNGVYNLENVKTGTYMISVVAKHMHFEPLLVKISPISAIIPDITPNAFDVCGTFALKSSPVNTQITILFKSKQFSESITSDLSDGFCVALKPDKYSITQMSSNKNFKLIASQTTISVKSEPILNLKFTQFTATLSGEITTKDSANDIQLKVFNQIDNQLTKSLKFSDFRKFSANRLEFKIENVLPASYRISVSKESDSWCWQSDTQVVDVVDKDITDIQFIQKGYILSLFFSHKIEFDLKYPSNKVEKLKVGSDQSLKHCVTETGIYTIVPKGCHKFSESPNEMISFDASKDSGKLISRTAVKHMVSANVLTNLNVTDIVLTVKIKSFGNEEYVTERIHLEQHRVIKAENQNLFEYLITIWAKPMVNLYLEPSSSQLLFKPNSFQTKVENECLENAITFSGKIGLFIDGQITPKLEGVIIKILNSEQILLTTKTDSLGKYMAGPFDSDLQLTVSAEKEGYFFRDVANKLGHFEAIRLSKVSVHVTDDNKEPLSEVLISISGGAENYRKNSVTPSSGKLTFNNLHSGEYFLRVMMKEYDFEPSSQMVTVSDGSDLNIQIKAKKVAFSCIGITDSLNGEPEPGVVVEAIGLRNIVSDAKFNCSQLQEEAISEANGSFRIRGLRPECQYAIRIKSSDERNKAFNQSIPRIHLIRVEDKDITNVRLIIFRKSTQMDVSGDVVTPFEYLPSIKVSQNSLIIFSICSKIFPL